MVNVDQLSFGFRGVDITATAMWGARAIYSDRYRTVDLLCDRQSVIADTEAQRNEFCALLNAGALREFCRFAKGRFNNSDVVETVTLRGVTFFASTNRSYGYLYITAIPAGPVGG